MIFYLKINRCERMMILEKYKTFFCKGVIKKVNANTPTVDVYLCNTAIVWIGYLNAELKKLTFTEFSLIDA